MTAREVKNLAASARQRLANLAQTRGEPFQYVAEHYAIERFLSSANKTAACGISTISGWKAFLGRNLLDDSAEFGAVIDALREFLLPPLAAARSAQPFDRHWAPGGPWKK